MTAMTAAAAAADLVERSARASRWRSGRLTNRQRRLLTLAPKVAAAPDAEARRRLIYLTTGTTETSFMRSLYAALLVDGARLEYPEASEAADLLRVRRA